MIKDFSFGVLLFNQEEYIIETLESIKYQITKYGGNINNTIIIIDDSSKDKSIAYANQWINDNFSLFSKYEIIINECNKGTVHNYNEMLNRIEGEYFKVIAGDDVLGSTNLYSQFEKLDNNHIICFQRIELLEGKLRINDELLLQHYSDMNYRNEKNMLQRMRRGCFLHTPSTIFKRNLYFSSNASDFNKNFYLFEDDPTWYSILKSGKKVVFVNDIIVLYRIHNNSTSNSITGNEASNIFRNDMKKLHSIYFDDTSGLEHLLWKLKNENRVPKIFRIDKYLAFFSKHKNEIVAIVSHKFKDMKNSLVKKMKDEQIYYDMIRKNSEKFYCDYK